MQPPEQRDEVEMLATMLLIRRFEERASQQYQAQKIGGFCHLYIGQEAVVAGAVAATRPDDYIITEGALRAVLWGRDAQSMRLPADDPEGYYLVTYRMLVVWPYDENGYIIGEESWSSYPKDFIQKIDESEVPERFKAYVAGRKST